MLQKIILESIKHNFTTKISCFQRDNLDGKPKRQTNLIYFVGYVISRSNSRPLLKVTINLCMGGIDLLDRVIGEYSIVLTNAQFESSSILLILSQHKGDLSTYSENGLLSKRIMISSTSNCSLLNHWCQKIKRKKT